jgi:hypothetical protein
MLTVFISRNNRCYCILILFLLLTFHTSYIAEPNINLIFLVNDGVAGAYSTFMIVWSVLQYFRGRPIVNHYMPRITAFWLNPECSVLYTFVNKVISLPSDETPLAKIRV